MLGIFTLHKKIYSKSLIDSFYICQLNYAKLKTKTMFIFKNELVIYTMPNFNKNQNHRQNFFSNDNCFSN